MGKGLFVQFVGDGCLVEIGRTWSAQLYIIASDQE